MALSTLAKAGIAAAVFGGAVWADRRAKAKKKKKKAGIPEDYLTGYWTPGATLGAAESVIAEIEKPVYLEDIVMRDDEGNMHEVAEVTFYPPEEGSPDGYFATNTEFPKEGLEFPGNPIGRVVTNLYGPGAVAMDGELVDEFITGPVDPADPDAPAAVAIAVLQRLRPRINWSATAEGSAEEMVLDGAFILAEIIQQNLPGA